MDNVRKGVSLLLVTLLVLMALVGAIPTKTYAAVGDRVTLREAETVRYGTGVQGLSEMVIGSGIPDGMGDRYVYCVQPHLPTPPNGTYDVDQMFEGDTGIADVLRSLVYYAPNYPGHSYAENKWFKGTGISEDEQKGIFHVALSYALNNYKDDLKAMPSGTVKEYMYDNLWNKMKEIVSDVRSGDTSDIPRGFKCFYIKSSGYQNMIGGMWENGSLKITKSSSNTDITNGNAMYSLQGAVYGLYRSSDNGLEMQKTTDSKGEATFDPVPFGKYYIKEITAPKGYALDNTKHNVTIDSRTQVSMKLKDVPHDDPAPLVLGKTDKELKWTAENLPIGSASLKGAEFRVDYYDGQYATAELAKASGNPTRSWVFKTDEKGEVQFKDEYLVSGSALYRDSQGRATFPIGTILIQETKAPTGYLLNSEIFVRHVLDAQTPMEEVNTYNAPVEQTAIQEQIMRGDIKFVKAKDGTLERLANIPFKLTSTTTGESHVIVTDQNGEYQSASSFRPHTTNTNGNDSALDEASGKVTDAELSQTAGTWFGQDANGRTAAANNSLGALPYDTYILDELQCDANKDKTLLKGVRFKVYRNSTVIDLGVLTDDLITLTTHAIDREIEGQKSLPRDNVTIEDTINYDGVTPNQEITIKGSLVYAENGKPVKVDGEEVVAEKTFTPKAEHGQEVLTFTFDASDLGGQKIVVCEQFERPEGILAVHADLYDEAQTITFTDPQVDTVALDNKTKTHMAYAENGVTITDTVEYSGVIGQYEYELTGTLIDYKTGEPILINGKQITNTKTFYSNTAKGQQTMEFTFDGTGYEGKTIGVAQTLKWNGVVIAEHKDIKDEDQAIHFPKIHTSAKDNDSQGHMALARDEVSITDTITYENVIPDSELTLSGKLIDISTGRPFERDGEPVTGTATFTPKTANGTEDVVFTFNGADLEGKTLVVFETLEIDGHTLATHSVMNDEKQTIHFPKIRTKAVDSETNDHIALADDKVTVTDTVTYENVIPGEDFTMKGLLMGNADEPLQNSGEDITASTDFTADSDSGEVDVTFTFDASDFENKTGVVFESLEWDGHVVGEHKDITDKKQSVHFPEVRTTLLDTITKDHIALAGDDVELTDTVTYKNLLEGEKYTVKGTLLNKETGEEITVDGKAVTASETFTADKADGTVDVTFKFDASKLKGVTVVAAEEIEFKGHVVGIHKDIADTQQWLHFPKVLTVALDGKTNEHMAFAEDKVSITDTISYENVLVGEEYRAVGKLMVKDTEKPLLVDGKEVTAETTFTADKEDGTTSVTFDFDGSALAGKTLVVYETLYYKGNLVGMHCDMTDANQTIHFPKIGTTALDSATKEHVSFADNEVTVTDTVTYENVLPNKDYTLSGVLMDKESGESLDITAETTFTAEKADGTADVTFTFDATGFEKKTAVAFETLVWNGHTVAIHKDINDEEQFIHFPKIRTKADMSYAVGNNAKLVDTVTYENLVPGLTYTAKGYLMDADTGEAAEVGDSPIYAQTRFTPKEADGTVKVEFDIDGTDFEGKTVVVFEEMNLGKELIAEHKDMEDTDQTVKFPKIRTSVLDSDTEKKVSYADNEVTIIDTVAYENLTPEQTYTIKGTLMDKDNEKPLLDASEKEITAEAEFTAEEESGTTEVTFTFDGSNLSGLSAVAFEDLLIGDKVIGRHADIDDAEQTDVFPAIKTSAAEKGTGEKVLLTNKEAVIIDTVEYSNLLVGEEYTVSGVLMDKETEKPITGETVEMTFTPSEQSGTVDMEFTLDPSNMDGKETVVFETLSLNEQTVAVHEDINDKDQTVSFEAPQTVQTYQTLPWQIIIAIGMAILSLAAVVFIKRRRA